MNYTSENIEECNQNKEISNKMCLVIRNLINSNLPIVTEIFIRCRKRSIFLVFIPQSYFALPKYLRLNSTHYFIMKIPNKQELPQITFEYFMNIFKKGYCKKRFFFNE